MRRVARKSVIAFLLGISPQAFSANEIETQLAPIEVVGRRTPLSPSSRYTEFRPQIFEVGESRVGSSLERVLSQSPSVQNRVSGGEASSPQFLIRGMDSGQQRFFFQGVPLTDAEFNSHHIHLLPVEIIGQTRVYPEGVPVSLASDGLGGAIDLQMAPGDSSRWTMGARGGAYGYARAVLRSPLVAGFNLLGAAARSDEGFSYFDDNGTPLNVDDDQFLSRAHNRFERVSLFPSWTSHPTSQDTIEAWGLFSWQRLQVPGSVRNPISGNLSQFYHLSSLQHERENKSVRWKNQIWIRLNQENLDGNLGSGAAALPGSTFGRALGGKSTLDLGELDKDGLGITVAALSESYSKRSMTGERELTRLQIPVGVSGSVSINRIAVRPALQAHHFRYSGRNEKDRLEWLASPRLMVEVPLMSLLRVRATVGDYYRSPTLNELFGSASGLSANPNLQVERAAKIEAGVDLESSSTSGWISSWGVSYTASLAQARNQVAYVQNSQDSRVAVNVGASRLIAHEVVAEANARSGMGTKIALTHLEAINLTDAVGEYGKYLPYRPSLRVSAQLSYDHRAFSVAYGLVFQGESFLDLTNARRMGATGEHSLFLTCRSRTVGSFSLELLNLTDVTTAQVNTGQSQYTDLASGYLGYPAPGRRVYFNWRIEV